LQANRIAAACRGFGWQARTLADVYGQAASQEVGDVDWILRAGDEGWDVLTKDKRIAQLAHERTAVLDSGTRVFCLILKNGSGAMFVELLTSHRFGIERRCRRSGPAFFRVYPDRVDRVERVNRERRRPV
jgi:PIN like domain